MLLIKAAIAAEWHSIVRKNEFYETPHHLSSPLLDDRECKSAPAVHGGAGADQIRASSHHHQLGRVAISSIPQTQLPMLGPAPCEYVPSSW